MGNSPLESCIKSSADFNANISALRDLVKAQDQKELDIIFNEALEILNDQSRTPTEKFYTVLSVLRISETKDKLVIERLQANEDLLAKYLPLAEVDEFLDCSKKGLTYFKGKGEENKIIGNNFINLVLESIVFWNREFGGKDASGIDNSFTRLYNKLDKGIVLPEKYMFHSRQASLPEDYQKVDHYITPAGEDLTSEENRYYDSVYGRGSKPNHKYDSILQRVNKEQERITQKYQELEKYNRTSSPGKLSTSASSSNMRTSSPVRTYSPVREYSPVRRSSPMRSGSPSRLPYYYYSKYYQSSPNYRRYYSVLNY